MDALLGVYSPPPIVFVDGEGANLIDEKGRRYLDFTSGIGVSALGHRSPVVRRAIEEALQAGLVHVSNLFQSLPGAELASFLADRSGLDQVFFCNSGAESVEGALKFARKWAKTRGGEEKHGIVALKGSFHGRLFGSLAVTDRPEYRAPFEPLMPGVDFADPCDPSSLDAALSVDRTAAVIVEPVQGEGGIQPLPFELLRDLRRWTRERGIALVADEVQCGLGRAGTLFACEPSGIIPDVVCIAKPMAGGFPMGAILVSREIAQELKPGDHGTTFGGGPFISTIALAVLKEVGKPSFLERVRSRGEYLASLLRGLAEQHASVVTDVRGRGLFWGVELCIPAGPVVERAREHGLLTVPAGGRVIRLLPPLTVETEAIDQAISLLGAALQEPGEQGAAR